LLFATLANVSPWRAKTTAPMVGCGLVCASTEPGFAPLFVSKIERASHAAAMQSSAACDEPAM